MPIQDNIFWSIDNWETEKVRFMLKV